MKQNNSLEKDIKAVIYGFVVGDCLGVPVEFKNRDSFHVTEMEGYGTHHQPAGTWSDDTSLSLALIEALYEKRDIDGLMDKFVAYKEGYLTPYGECFDIGISTSEAIRNYLSKIPAQQCGGTSEYDNGNGAIMRLSPLAIFLKDGTDFKEKCAMITKYTTITHGHPRCIVASILYVNILIGLLKGYSLKDTMSTFKPVFESYFKDNEDYWHEYTVYFSDMFDETFFEKDRIEIASTGYVVDTLKACIWCLGTTDSFESAVLKAVNLGNDTDTIGAITGSMAGALYKLDSIPKQWINTIASKKIIDEKCGQLLKVCIGKDS